MNAGGAGGRTCLAIVLAAGEGTRMHSSLPKVLHQIAGRTLLSHVLLSVREAGGMQSAVVIGPDHQAVATEAKAVIPHTEIFVQTERRGTAHAVLAAKAAIAQGADDVLVLVGDAPLIQPQTLAKLRSALADGAAVAVLGFRPGDPTGYGRLITEGDALVAIREHADASEAERAITLCNAGLMGFAGSHAMEILEQIGSDNRKKEFYLTDAVAIARRMGLKTVATEVMEDEVSGINSKSQLAAAEGQVQQRLRQAALDAGVTLVAPETVFLAADTRLGRNVTIEPYVVFGPGVTVEDGATIRSFSHIHGAHVGKNAIVGPYARLRPGAKLGEKVHVGNFVEVKEATLEAGAKANHLSYIGDARVGEGANIGAGTITCNYDGFAKHVTDIGKGAFIGSNTALVAPVKIGDGAYIGSGSVITKDVPTDALALERSQQIIKEGWAKRLRSLKSAGKK
jgi:bifunctional UDP-N-acetylglucosamine pyrophosphorylase/glucosamine-1-phosphate N-acetyltransferase